MVGAFTLRTLKARFSRTSCLRGLKRALCLPVYDAVAVHLDNIGWACDQMRYQWDKQMSVSGLARVTTDISA